MRFVAHDVRYAWRGLLRTPVFTAVALVSIALGIGANTAIFTLVDRVLMRPLPVEAPEQLVLLGGPAGRNYYGASVGSNVLSFPSTRMCAARSSESRPESAHRSPARMRGRRRHRTHQSCRACSRDTARGRTSVWTARRSACPPSSCLAPTSPSSASAPPPAA
jgi:hypothetical protein